LADIGVIQEIQRKPRHYMTVLKYLMRTLSAWNVEKFRTSCSQH